MRIELLDKHDRSTFSSGQPSLDEWFQKYSAQNHRMGNSRTYVAVDNDAVVGFVSMSASVLIRSEAPSRIAKNAPAQIPGILIGRLAVDSRRQGEGIGTLLLSFALRRAVEISDKVGVRIVQISAIDESAKNFYLTVGEFEYTPSMPMMLSVTVTDLKRALGGTSN